MSDKVVRLMTKIFTKSVIQFTETKPLLLVYIKNSAENPQEKLRPISMKTNLPIPSEQMEISSIEKIYNILIRDKGNDKICKKVPHGDERSASFLTDTSKLNCLYNL